MRFVLCFLVWLFPTLSMAQQLATLVADSVVLEDQQRLVATGNVEVFFEGTTLTARQIVFDADQDRLEITGPLVLRGPDQAVLIADRASLDPKLQNGLLRGARLVLAQQLQLAANQIDRVDGRYSQLYKTAVTSCPVCGGTAPLWSIRAERVIHDEVERQIYFENAQFLVRDVPLIWLPRLRLPDPTLDRATGFLIPKIRTTDQLSTGIKIPYFITLGDHRDLTFTPYLSNETTTLETRYRQAFVSGDLEVNLAGSRDTLRPGELRYYLFADGSFDLPSDYKLKFDIETVSDPAYLLDYGYSGKDRIDSAIEVSRITEDTFTRGAITYFETLRDDETNETLPPLVADLSFEGVLHPRLGGSLDWTLSADALVRPEPSDGAIARDVARVGAELDWSTRILTDAGFVVTASTGTVLDFYLTDDDSALEPSFGRIVPTASATLAFPLVRSTSTATHIVEPTLAASWSKHFGTRPPNEDANRPELDQGNLFWPDQLPGEDVVAEGFRGALGVTWTRHGRDDTTSRLTFGRVYQDTPSSAFTSSSGLDSSASDWLVAGDFALRQGFRFEGRALLSKTLRPTLATGKVDWATERLSLSASYIWQEADDDLGTDTLSEWSFDTAYQVTDTWKLSFDTRYDIIVDRPARAGVGIEWRNECVTVDLSVSRRFTSSTTVEPSTDYGLSVALNGFSTNRSAARRSTRCTN